MNDQQPKWRTGCFQSNIQYENMMDAQFKISISGADYLLELTRISGFELLDGWGFVHDNILSIVQKVELTSLFKELVKIQWKTSISDPDIFKILPTFIFKFAEQARASTEYRLLARAVKHGMDPLCPDIQITEGNVIK